MFQTAVIVGPGLIGGSMGMAMRQRRLAARVVGVGRRQESLARALQVGALDEATLDLEEAVSEADLVVLATPIAAIEELAARLADCLPEAALLTDVASSKASVIETVLAAFHGRPDLAYLPSHPMAGSEQSGPLAASADLFEGSVCILTPLTTTTPEDKRTLTALWNALGARVVSMSPQAHDRLVARISHLPHLAAAALMMAVQERDMPLCGGGLRDTTRVAAGSPSMWTDICRANTAQIHQALTEYIGVLTEMAEALEAGRMDAVERMLTAAKKRRDSLAETEPRR